jgi:hypothetical protein
VFHVASGTSGKREGAERVGCVGGEALRAIVAMFQKEGAQPCGKDVEVEREI